MYILTAENMYGVRKLINTESLIQCYRLDNEIFAEYADGTVELGVYDDGDRAERELSRLYRSIARGSHGHRMREGVFREKPSLGQRIAEWFIGDTHRRLDPAELMAPTRPPKEQAEDRPIIIPVVDEVKAMQSVANFQRAISAVQAATSDIMERLKKQAETNTDEE